MSLYKSPKYKDEYVYWVNLFIHSFNLPGTRTHETEDGSKASKHIHLAGIENVATDKIVQTFCMKTSYTQDGDYEFEAGGYLSFLNQILIISESQSV